MARLNLRKNTVFTKACATCYFRPGCPRETIRLLVNGFDLIWYAAWKRIWCPAPERSLVTNKRRSLTQLFYDLHHELRFGNENISSEFGCGGKAVVTCFTTIATLAWVGGGNVTHNILQEYTHSNRAPFDKSEIYTGEDHVRNPDNHMGTSHLLLTKRRVNNQQWVKRMQPLFSTSYWTINIRSEGTTRFMTLLELCPNAAASSHLWCRNTCQSYFTEVKVPIPVASTINTNTRSQWNVGDRSHTCWWVGVGGWVGRRGERERRDRRGQWRHTAICQPQYPHPRRHTFASGW